MSKAHDFSTVSQYAALGEAMRLHAGREKSKSADPVQISGLEAMGRYVGCADTHPAREVAPRNSAQGVAAPRSAVRTALPA